MDKNYESMNLEDLCSETDAKLELYLMLGDLKKDPDDAMMYYQERLASEKQLFIVYRQLNDLLDILIK